MAHPVRPHSYIKVLNDLFLDIGPLWFKSIISIFTLE